MLSRKYGISPAGVLVFISKVCQTTGANVRHHFFRTLMHFSKKSPAKRVRVHLRRPVSARAGAATGTVIQYQISVRQGKFFHGRMLVLCAPITPFSLT